LPGSLDTAGDVFWSTGRADVFRRGFKVEVINAGREGGNFRDWARLALVESTVDLLRTRTPLRRATFILAA
jgi:hypothetical protein